MFAEMPLDNRTVGKFTAGLQPVGPALAFPAVWLRNDLMFRPNWQFCNIEPKICQYG
jgi:hypothetical protein